MTLPGSILTLALLSGAAASMQTTTPPVRHTHRRRAPAPDPEKEALRKKLADATMTIGKLDSRVLELMAETASLRQELQAGAIATAELQQRLDAANQSATSLQARLKTAEERLEKLAAERKATQPLAAQPAQRAPAAEEARLQAQLEDITRRRDAYIASILRRYRELANEYRTFGTAFAVPNDRDPTSKTGPELMRIQNTIALVEEELRQLNGLEAQAALVRKAQAKAKTP